MAHNKSRFQDRKVFYIAPLIIACVLAVLFGVTLLRQPRPFQDPKRPPPLAAAKSSTLKLLPPAAITTLSRSDLITYVQRATSQFSATGRPPAGADPLMGRRFVLNLPFGCNGANGEMLNPQTMVSYDAAQESLTLAAQPGVWTSLPVMQPLLEAGQAEAVEGFWVPRPWTQSEACPPANNSPLPAIATPATAQTLGVAQIFPPGSARTLRHSERGYILTRKLRATETDLLSHSYRLILEGTITGYPDGQSLHCWSEAVDHQPICIFAVTLEKVAFQDVATDQIVASWSD